MSQGPIGGFTHYLGEEYLGGIIFHLYKWSDGLEHGLIVHPNESQLQWQTTGTLRNADRVEDGAYNTNLMTGSPAKNYINGLGSGWYLPSIDELSLIFYNRYSIDKGFRGKAGSTPFSIQSKYWSSTEYIATVSLAFDFYTSSTIRESKTSYNYVRAIKAF